MQPIIGQLKRLVLNEKGEISLTKVGGAIAIAATGLLQQHLLPGSCDVGLTWTIGLGTFLAWVGLRDAQTK